MCPGQTKLQGIYWSEYWAKRENSNISISNLEEVSFPDITRKKCLFCGEQNLRLLEEHHIIPRRLHNSLPAVFHILLDFDRTVTLCKTCHRKIHVLIKPIIDALSDIYSNAEELYIYDKIVSFLLLSWNGRYITELYSEFKSWCENADVPPLSFDEVFRLLEYFEKRGFLKLVKVPKINDYRIIIKTDPNTIYRLFRSFL